MMTRTKRPHSATSLLLLLVFLGVPVSVLCDNELRIHDASGFIAFSDAVNSGTDFIGVTVYLDSDIDFTDDLSQQFDVIGKDVGNYFRGTFDGRGHAIRNLAVNASSSYQHVGLFGYSIGTTIQNVVIDDTCGFTNNYASSEDYDASTGGIIGYCYAYFGSCTLENNVNMADITFNGNTSSNSFTGGIAGELYVSKHEAAIKNCANYGTVSSTGTSDYGAYVGGIVGFTRGKTSYYTYAQNCANYGTVFYNGTTNDINVGGISGYSRYSIIDNCISSDFINVSRYSEDTYVGSIVGYALSSSVITHCYWNVSIEYGVCGHKSSSATITDSYSFNPSTFGLAEPVSIGNYAGTSLIGALNGAADYYILREYSHWALNKDGRNVSFTVNKTKLSFTTNAQVILLPDLASGGNMTFSGWYTDNACTVPLAGFTIDSDDKKDFYGLWGAFNYTINFDTRGGSALSSITSPYGTTVELPTSTTKDRYKFLNWETEYDDPVPNTFTIPSRNITLYAVWLCEHIATARDLIAFSDAVNSGTNFKEATVYLDSDIDFTDELSERFEVIGKDANNHFRGTFDGQGHAIRNLVINASSSYQHVGLFGYSIGTTIQNVVIDDTCGFTNNYASSEDYAASTGGIIGYCYASDDPCTLENNVNMASIAFNGNTTGYSSTGGVAGELYASKYEAAIKNCANYGVVADFGTNEGTYLGGVVSRSRGKSSYYTYVQNCANYGTLLCNGTTTSLHVGGISGYSKYSTIDNCVNSGPIIVGSSGSENTYVGSIVGYVALSSAIAHCYWNVSTGHDACGRKYSSTATITDSYSFDPSSFELYGPVSIGNYTGTSLIGALNGAADYYILREYSHWALNKDSRNVSFTVNKTKLSFITNAQVILLPDLAGGGNMSFSGWYTDSACTVPLIDFTIDSDEKKDLYGLWGVFNYIINFDTRGGSALSSITSPYGTTVELSTSITRSGCNFMSWENEYGDSVTTNSFTVPSRNITLYAVWLCEHITTARDLIALSDAVNSGTSFIGTTVYLDSDIDFTDGLSERFEAIGNDDNNFRGTFDGQGHVIRNLVINASSSYQYVGLFGYSIGTTIRNVVIDDTCGFTNNYVSEYYDAYIGSIAGYFNTHDGSCTLENSVNMASTTSNGNTDRDSFTGGIIGELYISKYEATIKNCANYGAVLSTGTSDYGAYVGGIVGLFHGDSSIYVFAQNCANYGTVFYNGTTSYDANVGGIPGYSEYSTIENCVNSGYILIDSSSSAIINVGSIIGYVSESSITHCYWNMSIGYDACGDEDSFATITNSYSFDPSTFELAESVSIGNYAGTSLIGALNGAADYYILRDYSHWALNKDGRNVSFTVNGRSQSSFTTNTQVILLPDLAGGGNMSFSGWYTDGACTVLLTDFTIDSDEKKDLYGLWDVFNYTINFDTRGGSAISSITSPYGSTVEIPSTTRSGCNFLNWETEYDDPVPNSFTIPSRNITLYAVWLCEHITTSRELIVFSDAVNSGTSFKGMTVYLDSDIDFTDGLPEQFEMIGKDKTAYFRGTFDGQGHVIRNLAVNASPSGLFFGLFGYSAGTTIKNVVIDETCSFVNIYVSSEDDAYTGGIIGYCYAYYGPCTLENNVNMADIMFNGNTTGYSSTGGVVGIILSINYQTATKNCANYGTISNTGTSDYGAYVGGVVGSSQGSLSHYTYVQNCANYGTVLHDGTSNIIAVGGISGFSYYSTIENCVSSGSTVVVSSPSSTYEYVGNIVGFAYSSTTITHCYWTLDVRCNNITTPSDSSVTATETTYVERLNTTTLDELNAYVSSHKLDGFSQWAMLRLNGGSVSNLNQSDLVVAQEHFPSPVKEGNTFLRWCKDLECGEVYDNDLTGVTALYAVWKTVRVTFTFWNGTTAGAASVEYGTAYGALPEAGAVVEGHTLCWFISNDDDDERVVTSDTIVTISSDHTLHGRWVAINYTVSLDLGNGTVITRTLQYNEVIELPQGIAREGCTHTGWDNSNTTTMPAKNIIINALWDCTHNSHSSYSSGDKSKSSSNAGAIVGGVVGGLVAIVLIVFAVLFFILFKDREEEDSTWGRAARRMKMRRNKARGRSSSTRNAKDTRQQTRRGNRGESFETGVEMATDTARTYEKLYPTWYNVSTMQDALTSVGLSQSQAKSVVDACNLTGRNAEREGKLPEGLTSGDAAAIAMYTYSFDAGNYGSNPYRLINEALMGDDEEEGGELDKVKGLLYLVMCSLRRLPKYTGKTLYRGVKEGVDRTLYKKGNSVVWHGLSSTSPDMNAVKSFLASNTVNKRAEGTLFIIDNGWGYDIQPYSLFPEEAEILLEPEREFKVQDVIEAELTVIKLQMVDTPVILPEIFGENAN